MLDRAQKTDLVNKIRRSRQKYVVKSQARVIHGQAEVEGAVFRDKRIKHRKSSRSEVKQQGKITIRREPEENPGTDRFGNQESGGRAARKPRNKDHRELKNIQQSAHVRTSFK